MASIHTTSPARHIAGLFGGFDNACKGLVVIDARLSAWLGAMVNVAQCWKRWHPSRMAAGWASN